MTKELRKTIRLQKVREILDCSEEFVRKELRRGRLKGIKIGTSAIRVYQHSLEQYMTDSQIVADEQQIADGKKKVGNYV